MAVHIALKKAMECMSIRNSKSKQFESIESDLSGIPLFPCPVTGKSMILAILPLLFDCHFQLRSTLLLLHTKNEQLASYMWRLIDHV